MTVVLTAEVIKKKISLSLESKDGTLKCISPNNSEQSILVLIR